MEVLAAASRLAIVGYTRLVVHTGYAFVQIASAVSDFTAGVSQSDVLGIARGVASVPIAGVRAFHEAGVFGVIAEVITRWTQLIAQILEIITELVGFVVIDPAFWFLNKVESMFEPGSLEAFVVHKWGGIFLAVYVCVLSIKMAEVAGIVVRPGERKPKVE